MTPDHRLFPECVPSLSRAQLRKRLYQHLNQLVRLCPNCRPPCPNGRAQCLAQHIFSLLAAVIYHSDHLELSEQFDDVTGYEKSVKNLTWSCAAFLSAVRARTGQTYRG
jgi:hypothetical protein